MFAGVPQGHGESACGRPGHAQRGIQRLLALAATYAHAMSMVDDPISAARRFEQGCVFVARAATISAALALATGIVRATAHARAGFAMRDRILQASVGSVLVGIMCLGAVGVVAVAIHLEANRTIMRRVLAFTTIITSIALLVAIAGAWSYLSIHVDVTNNFTRPGVTANLANPTDYSISYRVAGSLNQLSAITLLASALWVARQQPRGHPEITPKNDDITSGHP